MSESTPLEWRSLYAAAMSEGESSQLEPMIEEAEQAIQHKLREVVDDFSAFEESELYAALRIMRRMRSRLLIAT